MQTLRHIVTTLMTPRRPSEPLRPDAAARGALALAPAGLMRASGW